MSAQQKFEVLVANLSRHELGIALKVACLTQDRDLERLLREHLYIQEQQSRVMSGLS